MAHPATKHFSIIDVVITDDFVDRRTKAAAGIATRWRKLPNASVALAKASSLAEGLISAATGGPVPGVLRQEIGAEIHRQAPTHDADDPSHDFEVAVVAAVAAIMVIDGSAAKTEYCAIFAEAVSAAMDISSAKGAPRVADLWNDLSAAARSAAEGNAERSRQRHAIDSSDVSAALAALDLNARKDSEEINTLWWTLNNWTTLAHQQLSLLPTNEATVVAGVEMAGLLTWPALRAHRQLAHRNIKNREDDLALADLALDQGDLQARVHRTLEPLRTMVAQHPRVFVALTSILAPDEAAASSAFGDLNIDAQQKMQAWRWCERTVREISLAKSAGASVGPLE